MRGDTAAEAGQASNGYTHIAMMVFVTHILFTCCLYAVWTATGEMMAANWTGFFSSICAVLLLLVIFAKSKIVTLNRLFDKI